MPPAISSDAATFEQQIRHLLVTLQYGHIRRIEGERGIGNFYAERETDLGSDSIYVALDFWRDDLVGRRQVEQVVGRMAAEPATRAVIITTGRFDEAASEYASRVGVTLIEGDRIATLLQKVESGAGITTALEAARVPTSAEPAQAPSPASSSPSSPQPASAPPPALSSPSSPQPASAPPPAPSASEDLSAPPDTSGEASPPAPASETAPAAAAPGTAAQRPRPQPGGPRSSRKKNRRAARRKQPLSERALTVGVFVALFLVVGLLTTLVLVLGERRNGQSERPVETGAEVTIESLGSGTVVRVRGRAMPNQALELHRNGTFVERTTADQQGDFTIPFVPLALEEPNTLTLHSVTPEGRPGDVLWRSRELTAPAP